MKTVQLVPRPSRKDPFSQIDFLFNHCYGLKNEQTKRRKRSSSSCIKKWLRTNTKSAQYLFPNPFFISQSLHKYIIVSFKEYLEEQIDFKRMSHVTAREYLCSFYDIIEYAADNNWTKEKHFVKASIPNLEAWTTSVDSYTDFEISEIERAIKCELEIYNVAGIKPYHRTGLGRNPSIRYRPHFLDSKESYGWQNLNNCLWYFENVMFCDASFEGRSKYETKLFFASMIKFGSAAEFFRKIGYFDNPDIYWLGPWMLKLVYLTGLNPTSLFELKVDCLTERDPITNSPSLTYCKRRSGGDMKYHLSVHDEKTVIQDLKLKQYLQIKKIIGNVIFLTSKFRLSVEPELKNRLFIFQRDSIKEWSTAIYPTSGNVFKYCQYLVNKYQLKDSNKAPLSLTIMRFRSTRLSQMSVEGRNEFEIQAAAGHKSIQTTMNYLRLRNLETVLDEETRSSLKKVFENTKWAEKVKPKIITSRSEDPKNGIYKGVFCDCRNIFDPPKEVRKTIDFKEGQACTFYNMCLSCPNVVVTKFHLPMLFKYRNEILASESFNSGDLPLQHVYKKSLSILNSLLDEKYSEFSKEDLRWARSLAEIQKQQYIDPLFYVPTII